MGVWNDGLWDNLSDNEAERRQHVLTAVRMETATAWPFLAQATDREDFANRLAMARPRIQAAAARHEDDTLAHSVEASYANDFEKLLKIRTAVLKFSPEDLDTLRQHVGPLDTAANRETYRSGNFPRADKVNDLDKRYRWDLYSASGAHSQLTPYEKGYDDTHIDSALKNIVPPLAHNAAKTAADSLTGQPSTMKLLGPPPGMRNTEDTHLDAHPEIRRMVDRYHVGTPDSEIAGVGADWAEKKGWKPDEVPHQQAVSDALNVHHHNQDVYADVMEHRAWPRSNGGQSVDPNQMKLFASKTADKAPYYIEQHGGDYVVVNKDGDVKGTHATKEQAREQQKAMYANIPDAAGKAEKAHGDPKPKVKTSALHTAACPNCRAGMSLSGGYHLCGGCGYTKAASAAELAPACPNCSMQTIASKGGHELCESCGYTKEAAVVSCPSCGRRTSDLEAHYDQFHPDEDLGDIDSPKYNRPGSGHYTHWSETDDEGNAIGTGRKKRTASQGVNGNGARTATLSPEEVKEARQEATGRRIEAANRYDDDEFDAGLPCHTASCDASFYTEEERLTHMSAIHGVPRVDEGRPRRRLLRRRAANEENLKEKCPICGKEVPASEMANHMKKNHPHEAIKPDDEERAQEHKKKKEGKVVAGPFDGAGANNPFTPDSTSQDINPTQDVTGTQLPDPSSQMSSPIAPLMSGSTSNPSLAPTQDMSMPPNINPRTSHKLAMIEADLRHLNPGIPQAEARRLAVEALSRYPQIAAEARGGADYIDGEALVDCPQCGKQAYSDASHHCHNCGFIQAA